MPMIPVSEVAGSASDAFKETSLRSFNKFMWTKNDRFASDVATAVRVKEISVDDDAESPAPGRRITKVVCEIDVTERASVSMICATSCLPSSVRQICAITCTFYMADARRILLTCWLDGFCAIREEF